MDICKRSCVVNVKVLVAIAVISFISACAVEPMPEEIEKLGKDRALQRGDLVPLEKKVDEFSRLTQKYYVTNEGLLSYRVDWPYAHNFPAKHSDTLAWTSLWVVTCALNYRVTGDRQALKDMEKSLRGLNHLARISGVKGLLSRTMVPIDSNPSDSDNIRVWKRGKKGETSSFD